MPVISVIVPVYNVEPYLKRCIDSILAQSYRDFELILVNDGSTDHCGEICDKYAAIDSRIKVIHQKNAGLSAARNSGIDWVMKNSNSKWITFVDSDDWIHYQYLEYLLCAVVENKMHIGVCRFTKTTQFKLRDKGIGFVSRIISPEDFFIEETANAIVAWGKIYWKELFVSIRYPVGKLHEDGYITHRLLFGEPQIVVVDESLYYYYVNLSGITHTYSDNRLRDAVEGQHLRTKFFQDNGFVRAYDFEIQTPGYISNELAAMNKGIMANNKRYKRILIKRLRKSIYQNKIRFPANIWLYELAYPNLMRIYWMIIAIINKVKRFCNG